MHRGLPSVARQTDRPERPPCSGGGGTTGNRVLLGGLEGLLSLLDGLGVAIGSAASIPAEAGVVVAEGGIHHPRLKGRIKLIEQGFELGLQLLVGVLDPGDAGKPP